MIPFYSFFTERGALLLSLARAFLFAAFVCLVGSIRYSNLDFALDAAAFFMIAIAIAAYSQIIRNEKRRREDGE
jgi:hypothetical protein